MNPGHREGFLEEVALRPRDVKKFVQCHTAVEWKSWDFNPEHLTPHPYSSTKQHCLLSPPSYSSLALIGEREQGLSNTGCSKAMFFQDWGIRAPFENLVKSMNHLPCIHVYRQTHKVLPAVSGFIGILTPRFRTHTMGTIALYSEILRTTERDTRAPWGPQIQRQTPRFYKKILKIQAKEPGIL